MAYTEAVFRRMCMDMIQGDACPNLLPTTKLMYVAWYEVDVDLQAHKKGPVCAHARYQYGTQKVYYTCTNGQTYDSYEALQAAVLSLPPSMRDPPTQATK